MDNQKIENLLNLSLWASPEERMRSAPLGAGYDPEDQTFEVVIRYQGDPSFLEEAALSSTLLLGNYAILRLSREALERVSLLPRVTFMEMPKSLYFAAADGRAASCINPVQSGSAAGVPLTGKGVLLACLDSGVDYTHPDFRRPDGSTRILRLWDQTVPDGPPPEGYHLGTLYTEEQINAALDSAAPLEQVPSRDASGHGTAVLGVAAGNGLASGGVLKGAAPEASLLAVKLGTPKPGDFPRTTQLMQALDYAVRFSIQQAFPLAVNISFGNSYGSHSGDSLLETYIDAVSGLGRNVICVGAGNDGEGRTHHTGRMVSGQTSDTEFSITPYTLGTSLQIWKQYVDEADVWLIHPGGESAGPLRPGQGPLRIRLANTEVLALYGMPGPFSLLQEIFLDFLPAPGASYVDSGVWTLRLTPRRITHGTFHMWLPGSGSDSSAAFYLPSPDATLTIPSTAGRALTAGAYNSGLSSYAPFSGRGQALLQSGPKPDLAAPGVDIQAPRPGGGYGLFTGTSFAAPFVAGSAALLMEWGIVRGNDPFLYGEKLKAYLRKGARPLPGISEYPDPRVGYGALCLGESFP